MPRSWSVLRKLACSQKSGESPTPRKDLSAFRKRRPHRKVVAFVAEQPLALLYISTVTLAEIRFDIELVTDANRRPN